MRICDFFTSVFLFDTWVFLVGNRKEAVMKNFSDCSHEKEFNMYFIPRKEITLS